MCAEDKDRWDGMFQMEADEADLFSALKEKLKKRKEKMKKKDKKENMGLQLLFGGSYDRGLVFDWKEDALAHLAHMTNSTRFVSVLCCMCVQPVDWPT